MTTVFISIVIGNLFTVILVSAYRHKHMKDIAVNWFFVSRCLQSLAWGTLIFRNFLPGGVSIPLMNSILFVGSAFEAIALLLVQGAFSRRVKKFYFWLTLLYIVGFTGIYYFYNHENVRIVYASLCTSALIVYPAYGMITKRSASTLMRMMGWFYGVVALSLVGRAVMTIDRFGMMSLFYPGIYQNLQFISLYFIMILGNTGFILLSKERADDSLIRLASYDDLTEVLNRRTFIQQAEAEIKQLAGKSEPVSFILFDIDEYKTINDTYGHDVGDQVLKYMSKLVQDNLGTRGFLGRYGGDEFAILLPGHQGIEAEKIAEQLRTSISRSRLTGFSLKFTVSMGLVTVRATADTRVNRLYLLSDQALYEAKRGGRNRIVCSKSS
ncbi:GGDEF domain-containing protein [Paenibacillus sp. YPG26]|uniref:GGDEF domain-containing protein n=1 Tax=Paenibacillus sp. YPG26 TaxID=2878915 RepID=UPI0020422A0B|nr:GGDEF domain-containing protein [Paenibacillus sp. YPG26]USB33051.1 GGDEF domain-containing protein [Paenibacillus sp. YPG26]